MTPERDCAPGLVTQARGAGDVHGTANTDSVSAADLDRKRLADMRAKAALAGLRVHALDGGGGFVIVGPMGWCTRELRDMHALAQMLRQMGVQA
jgi:hypothetical protein